MLHSNYCDKFLSFWHNVWRELWEIRINLADFIRIFHKSPHAMWQTILNFSQPFESDIDWAPMELWWTFPSCDAITKCGPVCQPGLFSRFFPDLVLRLDISSSHTATVVDVGYFCPLGIFVTFLGVEQSVGSRQIVGVDWFLNNLLFLSVLVAGKSSKIPPFVSV